MGGLGYGKIKLINNIISHNWNVEHPEDKKFNYNEVLFLAQELLAEEGKPYFERKTGTGGFVLFREFVKYLLYRNLANYDSMVLLTGDKGSGKSSAAIMIARQWCILLGIRFSPKRHMAYTNADVMNKIDNLNSFEPIVADEAVRFATAAEWSKRENKELKKKLAQVRTKHLLYILCFPLKIEKLEKNYLDSFVNYWCNLFDRGVGAVFVKDLNPHKSSWGLEHFKKIGSYTEFTNSTKIEKMLKGHPNYWKTLRIPKPSEKLYARYMSVREANVYDDQNILGNVSKEDIYNALIILCLRDLITNDTTYTMNRIILHIKNQYDVNLTKGMIQAAISDASQLIEKVKEQIIKV